MKKMRMRMAALLGLALLAAPAASPGQDAPHPPTEARVAGPGGTSVVVRMQGPADADVPLQVVCYFRHTATSDARMAGAPVELDKRLGGLIAALRAGGEFGGDEGETLLIDPPPGTIRPSRLLLVGLGDESALSIATLERVGRAAGREAVRLGAPRAAFAPLIRDQGNTQFAAGAVEEAITRGVLLALDTEGRLARAGCAKPVALEEWAVEAGPAYFAETVEGVKRAIAGAGAAAGARAAVPPAGPR